MFSNKDNEPITEETWQWVALYNDGTVLKQFDYETGEYHYFADIDTDKIIKLGMINRSTMQNYETDIPAGATPVHYYDNFIQQPLGGEQTQSRVYCFGYELDGETNLQSILPDNSLIKGEPSGILELNE